MDKWTNERTMLILQSLHDFWMWITNGGLGIFVWKFLSLCLVENYFGTNCMFFYSQKVWMCIAIVIYDVEKTSSELKSIKIYLWRGYNLFIRNHCHKKCEHQVFSKTHYNIFSIIFRFPPARGLVVASVGMDWVKITNVWQEKGYTLAALILKLCYPHLAIRTKK